MSEAPPRDRRSRIGNAAVVAALIAAALVWADRQDAVNWPDAGATRWVAAAAAIAAYAALCVAAWSRSRRRRGEAIDLSQAIVVAFATQTGFAEELARSTAAALASAGRRVHLTSVADVDAAMLSATRLAFFIVATYGDGDPPDLARRFARDVLERSGSIGALRFGMLALGDRGYPQYCGFARRVEGWLAAGGAEPLFPTIDVDNGSPAAIARWHDALRRWTGDTPCFAETRFERWSLADRRLANPGSVGAATFALRLEPPAGIGATWEAGDIAIVRLPDGHQREYSIASLPRDRHIDLLVRRSQRADGTPGVGARWLTETLVPGDAVDLLIRANRGFRLESIGAATPLLLIGNGTGIAGLRAHLKARVAAGATRNWLFFGERHAAADLYYRDELAAWQRDGLLERATYAFSRDEPHVAQGGRYVQDRLIGERSAVAAWIAEGAVILVCGSAAGMAAGVDAALRRIVGDTAIDALTVAGRYRRDVY